MLLEMGRTGIERLIVIPVYVHSAFTDTFLMLWIATQ